MSFSLWEKELEVLVGSEESDELWHLDGLESTGLVNIEMSPSLGEVGGEVSIEVSSADFLVGAEDFLSAGHGFLLSDGGDGGNSGLLGLFLLLLGFFLDVVGEDGSHEKIIIISSESIDIWDWNENVLFFFFIIGGVGGGVVELDVGSHWWSVVGSVGGNISEVVLEDLLVSVGEN